MLDEIDSVKIAEPKQLKDAEALRKRLLQEAILAIIACLENPPSDEPE